MTISFNISDPSSAYWAFGRGSELPTNNERTPSFNLFHYPSPPPSALIPVGSVNIIGLLFTYLYGVQRLEFSVNGSTEIKVYSTFLKYSIYIQLINKELTL